MIRISRMTDYGIVLLTHFARHPKEQTHNVRDLAAETRLPLPTVSKILKTLTRSGIVQSHRGVKGGYRLTRAPEAISVAEIIAALDGPIAITDCTTGSAGLCELERLCPVSANWQRINRAVREALERVTLAEMAQPTPSIHRPLPASRFEKNRIEVLQPCP